MIVARFCPLNRHLRGLQSQLEDYRMDGELAELQALVRSLSEAVEELAALTGETTGSPAAVADARLRGLAGEAQRLSEHAHELTDRAVVAQATGMLVERHQLTPAAARARLRGRAEARGESMPQAALTVLARSGGRRRGPDGG